MDQVELMSRRSTAVAKDSTLSVNIIHCGLVTELSLPFPSSCSCSDETETKILVEDSRPVLLHLRFPKCLLTVVISVLE